MVPVEVSDEVLPLPVAMVPEILIAPVLLTVIPPVPVCEMPEIVNGAAISVKETAPPLVLVALKVETVLASVNDSPPTEVVVKVEPLTIAELLSLIVLAEVSASVLVPALTFCERVKLSEAPVVVMVIGPLLVVTPEVP